MSLPVVIDPEAQDEFDEAYDYYEGRRAGLGEAFADAVQVVLDRIGIMPHCVYYREESSLVRVISVFHTSRDPAIWQFRA